MSETYVIPTLAYLLQILGWLAFTTLVIWRFFLPPTVSHLGTGTNIYNINRKEQQERGMLALLAAIVLVIGIEKPEILRQEAIDHQYAFYIYLIAALFAGFSLYSFITARRQGLFVQLSGQNKGLATQIWGTVQSAGYFVLGIAMCFFWLTLKGTNFDMSKPSLMEETSLPNTEVISFPLYSKPDQSSQAIQVVIPKANISTTSGTCYFYQVTVTDTSGIIHEGFVSKGDEELEQEGVDILRKTSFVDKCKSNPVHEDSRTNENAPLDFDGG